MNGKKIFSNNKDKEICTFLNNKIIHTVINVNTVSILYKLNT